MRKSVKVFFFIVLLSTLGVSLGALMGAAEACTIGIIFGIASSATCIVKEIEKIEK